MVTCCGSTPTDSKEVELAQTSLSRHVRSRAVWTVGEDGQAGQNVGLADCSKHLPLVRRKVGQIWHLAYLSECPVSKGGCLSCEVGGDLVLALSRDLRGIRALSIIAPARDHVHARFPGNLPQVLHVPTHIRMPTVDDARHALLGRRSDVFDHRTSVSRRGGWQHRPLAPYENRRPTSARGTGSYRLPTPAGQGL